MPQPSWFTDAVFEQVKNLSLQISTHSVIFAPWAYSDEYFRLVGGECELRLYLIALLVRAF